MAHDKTQKQLIFDPAFTEDIRDIYLNDQPEGSTLDDFRIVEHPEFGALMFSPGKEAQALEVLFTAVGRAWYEAKQKARTTEE